GREREGEGEWRRDNNRLLNFEYLYRILCTKIPKWIKTEGISSSICQPDLRSFLDLIRKQPAADTLFTWGQANDGNLDGITMYSIFVMCHQCLWDNAEAIDMILSLYASELDDPHLKNIICNAGSNIDIASRIYGMYRWPVPKKKKEFYQMSVATVQSEHGLLGFRGGLHTFIFICGGDRTFN
ncbi:hypothetical protein LINPERPRIM_LOCUS7107, partial [Linum perenne]